MKNGAYLASVIGAGQFVPIQALSAAGLQKPDWYLEDWNPDESFLTWGKTLRVQPILHYKVAQPREMTSWRSWGGVLSDESANEEVQRITQELEQIKRKSLFRMEMLPVQAVQTEEEANNVLKNSFDVALVYAASGSGRLLESCVPKDRDTLIFLRHRSGPTYYWYEALSVAYLQTNDRERETRLGKTHVDDVVVDDYDDLLWKLRSIYALQNMKNSRIVAVGGPW